MTRDDVLALYRPIRASIQDVLRAAVRACSRADMERAAKQLGLWSGDAMVLPEGDKALEMLSDIALFEPNQRKRRAFDRFLAEAQRLSAPDAALAHRMGGAFFSLFRCDGRHEAAGVCLRDLLDGDRRLWMVDEGLEASAPAGVVFGTRLFDAGPFHAGFGVIVQPDEDTIETCVQSVTRFGRVPFRHSLAATLYGDALRMDLPPSEEELLRFLLERLTNSPSRDDGAPAAPKRRRRRG